MSGGAAPTTKALIAVDLGAESCRVSVLRWIEGAPRITLVHRFSNAPVRVGEGLHWPLATIVAGVDDGISRALALAQEGIAALAVDGWAVDYVRLNHEGEALGDPFCYRDLRTVAAEAWLHGRIAAERLRAITAITPMRINTLYQQVADREMSLPAPGGWLNLPEYLLYRLGGRAVSEQTMAAHSELIDAGTRTWSEEIFRAAELDAWAAPSLVEPGTDVGVAGADFGGLAGARLIAPACHDTASAVAGIAALGEDWAYISSGTWSLVGTLAGAPVQTAEAAAEGFTNLAGVGGLTCFHVNVNGMWMLSQCLAQWAGARPWGIEELVAQAEAQPAPRALLRVDAPELLLPGEMMQRMNAQLMGAGAAPLPEDAESAPLWAALIFHSLAERYREVLASVARHTGKQLRRVFVVGGGSRNVFLNRLIAERTGLEVYSGSAESSTIGNFAVQLAVLEGGDGPGAEAVHRWAVALQGACV